MSIADEISKLDSLRESGALSDEEYQRAKDVVLAGNQPVGKTLEKAIGEISTNTWGMLIHLTQFCGYVVPLAGLVVPIVLWQIKKGHSDELDQHGRIVANWIITEFIYGVVFGLLSFVVVGIPFLIALGALVVIFPIVGAVKANNGEIWRYPLSIPFFKPSEKEAG